MSWGGEERKKQRKKQRKRKQNKIKKEKEERMHEYMKNKSIYKESIDDERNKERAFLKRERKMHECNRIIS